MKTQISRDAHRPEKRYSGVYQQQGRMLSDADWNALSEIVKQRLDDALADVVGSGAPRTGGLKVRQGDPTPPATVGPLLFEGSRLYAGGVPAQVAPADPDRPFAYDNQADFPGAPQLPAQGTAFTLYADVWERAVDALEDGATWTADQLRDPALHGADTTTRTQTMAQVKWCPAGIHPEDDADRNPRRGDAPLTVTVRDATAATDPCDPCAGTVSIDRRVGNDLFRLEVHDVVGPAVAPTQITLKWSSENGAEQHLVGTAPADFKAAGFVYEVFNRQTEKLLGVHLATGVPERRPIDESFPDDQPPGPQGLPFAIRRWDGYAVLRRAGTGSWTLVQGKDGSAKLQKVDPPAGHGDIGGLGLEPGDHLVFLLDALKLDLSVKDHRFVAGDYWLAPVREAVHRPGSRVLDGQPPTGIVHHYLRLADVDTDGSLVPRTGAEQLRSEFLPLTELETQGVNVDCRVTVGEGGRYSTLEAAIRDLRSQGKLDIALCFLPGDHRFVSTQEFEILAQGSTLHLSLCGCGSGSRLLIAGNIEIDGVSSLEIRDLAIQFEKGAITAKRCGEITLERLVVTEAPAREVLEAAPPPFTLEAASIRVAACRFHFPNGGRAAFARLGNLLQDEPGMQFLAEDLAQLFSPGLDDEHFSAESLRVIEILGGLVAAERFVVSNAFSHISLDPTLPKIVKGTLSSIASRLGQDTGGPVPRFVFDLLATLRRFALKTPSLVLALDAVPGDVTLVDNQIFGTVSVYGQPDILGDLTEDQRNNLASGIRSHFDPPMNPIPGSGRLTVDHNEISRLVVGRRLMERLRELGNLPHSPRHEPVSGVFLIACLAQNRFTAGPIQLLARCSRLTDNVFEEFDAISGWSISFDAFYLGNAVQPGSIIGFSQPLLDISTWVNNFGEGISEEDFDDVLKRLKQLNTLPINVVAAEHH